MELIYKLLENVYSNNNITVALYDSRGNVFCSHGNRLGLVMIVSSK